MAQIRGLRGATAIVDDMARRIEADLAYIENWTLPTDVRILVMTVPHLLLAKNVY